MFILLLRVLAVLVQSGEVLLEDVQRSVGFGFRYKKKESSQWNYKNLQGFTNILCSNNSGCFFAHRFWWPIET